MREFAKHIEEVREADKKKKEMELQRQYRHKNVVRIPALSLELKESLLAQYQMICQYPMLWIDLPKPSNLTVNGLCNEFEAVQQEQIRTENSTDPNQQILYLKQVMASIRYYFNEFLSINILFESERAQREMLEQRWASRGKHRGRLKEKTPRRIDYCDVYGAEVCSLSLYLSLCP